MPAHDIIDNRNEKLIDHINRILSSSQAARFAVGYFFLSGFEGIAGKLDGVKEVRLLIGNTTTRETIEQIAEGYQRLEMVRDIAEAQSFPKRTESRKQAEETASSIKSSLELMDQTDGQEKLIKSLASMIEEKRLKVKVYTRGRLHAKAYIFDYKPLFDEHGKGVERHEKGIAVVGSSNLTLSGITHNTELNVVVQGNDNHSELVRWFDDLWKEASDFDEALMNELQQSWALAPIRPYDIYLKTLYALTSERLEGEDKEDLLWDDEIFQRLADFQFVAVRQAIQKIKDYGGVFIADVVGLGKSFIGAAIVRHFSRTEHARPLIICPAPLEDMWESYNETYQLDARVLSMGMLKEDDAGNIDLLTSDVKFRDRDFILVDESHNFRYPDTQRYHVLQHFLASGKRCCFLTATPRNKSAWDIYYQMKLFHQDDRTDLPINPPNLKDYFKLVEQGERSLPSLLGNVLIRRTRNRILQWYGYDAETNLPLNPARFRDYLDGKKKAYVLVAGRHQFFPHRRLDTIEYSIEKTYQGLYKELRLYMGKARKGYAAEPAAGELSYARYGLWHFVNKHKQKIEPYVSLHRSGINIRGLVRILLFKRFESSVYAFRETIKRLVTIHQHFLDSLNLGFIPAGEDAQALLYEADDAEESRLMDELRRLSARYKAYDFDLPRLKLYIEHDIGLLTKMLNLVTNITPAKDAKLQTLLDRLSKKPLNDGKVLIFTQYADTARYLYDNINPGGKKQDIEVIYSGDKKKSRVVGRFAPKANPEYRFLPGDTELNTLITTDVLAEGLNLQDCDKIINYDLHWNPVRLIQRFGRIDRIGSDYDVIYGFNFLPETELERQLGLHAVLHARIQEIHDTIGEDAAILDNTERLNEEAMYAIYEKKGAQLSLFEDDEDQMIDINEAEEIMRQLRNERPEEYQRIANLRDGIRSGKPSQDKGYYVFCQSGRFQQLYLADETGNIATSDLSRILNTIKCSPEVEAISLPDGYNNRIMAIQAHFREIVKQRQSELEHTTFLRQGQRYVLRELRLLFAVSDDETRSQINILEKAFRGAITNAVAGELNRLRRNGVSGIPLYKCLIEIYHNHNMRDWLDRKPLNPESTTYPRIICSEYLG